MVVAVDVTDDEVRLWSRTRDGIVCERDHAYRPTCYVGGPDDALAELAGLLAEDPKVAATRVERRFTSLRDDERARVLAVDVRRPSEVRTLARELRCVREPDRWAPGTLRLYDVDLGPKFRYCLDEGVDPTPRAAEGETHWPRSLSLSLPTPALADGDLTALRCDGEPLREADGRPSHVRGNHGSDATERAVLEALGERLAERDPDVLVLSSARLVPLVHDRAERLGIDCWLGRRRGHRRLAGANSYESYGRVGHSPARYDVPGRAIVDRSNSFFWGEGGLPGLFDLVDRSGKPLQETAWASIGTVFTAMQISEARERDVLVPWRAWTPEAFTSARTLHAADRGGFTFEPAVGVHEDVVEVDFASLYPRIMCEKRLSPETVRCDCHDRADVPGLDYGVCPDVDDPFVPSVLKKLVGDRREFKRRRRETDDPDERARLDAKVSALKWILVTCFGYQGYRNSKFGRVECHEAINAYAREILLTAKDELEAAGWRVLHGIVDSLWVTPDDRAGASGPEPIERVCDRVTGETGIPLEREGAFEWVCFVPRRDGRKGSPARYFGKRAGGEGGDGGGNASGSESEDDDAAAEGAYKLRGIEARQRSTPAFVAAVQRDLIETLDDRLARTDGVPDAASEGAAVAPEIRALAEPACDRLERAIGRVRAGTVDPADLVVRTRASKALDEYDQRTRTVAALERYRERGVERHPGQDVRYVVVDDDRRDRDRVRLPWEETDRYDADLYETLLVRACESVLAPLGWDRSRIRGAVADGRDLTLAAFE